MAKRKAKQAAKRKAGKRNRKETASCNFLYSLPDHLVHEILHWIRPKDENQQSIWQWVCRMCATCAVFRRVVQSVMPGVPPLTPTSLELVTERDTSLWSHAGVVTLLNTITQSNWMGKSIKCVVVEEYDFSPLLGRAAAEALRSLLILGSLPNLTDLRLKCPPRQMRILVDDKLFLEKLGMAHPDLTRLTLTDGVLGLNQVDYLSPQVFADLAASLPNLQRLELSSGIWLESDHLDAFFSNGGASKLTHFSIKGVWLGEFTPKVLGSIATHCRKLITLRARTHLQMPSRQFERILCSNKNLEHVDVNTAQCDNSKLFFESIVKHTPRLKEFRGDCCAWVDNDAILKIFNGQINAFGHVLLRKLGVKETGVTPRGLRAVLTLWRETGRVLPLEVYAWFSGKEDGVSGKKSMEKLANDFPDVDWDFSSPFRWMTG